MWLMPLAEIYGGERTNSLLHAVMIYDFVHLSSYFVKLDRGTVMLSDRCAGRERGECVWLPSVICLGVESLTQILTKLDGGPWIISY